MAAKPRVHFSQLGRCKDLFAQIMSCGDSGNPEEDGRRSHRYRNIETQQVGS
jgi:hypothetical protein